MKKTAKCLCLILSLLLFILPAAAEEASISLTGSATIYLEADLAELNIGVNIRNSDLSAAQEESASRIAAVTAALENAGIEKKDIATENFSVSSYTETGSLGVEKQYYRVHHMLNVTVRDISAVGRLIDLAVQAGANVVNSISFTSSKAQEAYEQAMKDAVEDGRKKAQILCEAAGASLGKIRTIDFISNSYGVSVMNSRSYKMADAGMGMDSPSTEIQSGSVAVSASVNLVFEITPDP